VRACVLIVDDHAVIRRMLHALFEADDIEICEAENGAEGVQKAQELNPGLVILDLSMPVMNGLDAARALQLTMPRVPLLMFTNNTGAAMEEEARSAGIFAVIAKSDANALQQLLAHAKSLLGLDGHILKYGS
jgi:CheY-like chemotaxis protein